MPCKDKINPANAAAESAKADLAQKQGLLTQANELSTKLWAESKKLPNDKELADAAAKAKATVDALTSGVEAATKEAAAKAEAAQDRRRGIRRRRSDATEVQGERRRCSQQD